MISVDMCAPVVMLDPNTSLVYIVRLIHSALLSSPASWICLLVNYPTYLLCVNDGIMLLYRAGRIGPADTGAARPSFLIMSRSTQFINFDSVV